jgi:folate-dependent phosphoribosylglycinamide formyltransferase PurN
MALDSRALALDSAVADIWHSFPIWDVHLVSCPLAPPIAAMRVALLTLEALASAAPVRRFVASYPDRVAFVGLSDPYRPQQGGMFAQLWRLLRHSGPRLLPYLVINFELPRIARWLPQGKTPPERTPMKILCARLGIPAEVVADMNASAFHERLAASGADIILTFHCDQILSAATVGCLPHGGLNVHPSLLPEYRGPVPTIHALLSERPQFGVSVHRLVPQIDAGSILAQVRLDLPARTTALEAVLRLHEAGVPLVVDVLDALARGAATEHVVAPLPYCGFPTGGQLKQLARMGGRTASWRDVGRALRTPV